MCFTSRVRSRFLQGFVDLQTYREIREPLSESLLRGLWRHFGFVFAQTNENYGRDGCEGTKHAYKMLENFNEFCVYPPHRPIGLDTACACADSEIPCDVLL